MNSNKIIITSTPKGETNFLTLYKSWIIEQKIDLRFKKLKRIKTLKNEYKI